MIVTAAVIEPETRLVKDFLLPVLSVITTLLSPVSFYSALLEQAAVKTTGNSIISTRLLVITLSTPSIIHGINSKLI